MKQKFRGIIAAATIGALGYFVGQLLPIIGASVFALTLGILLNLCIKKKDHLTVGLRFSSKTLLKTAIVLLGAGLSLSEVFRVSKYSLFVMCFTLIAAYLSGWFFGKVLKILF